MPLLIPISYMTINLTPHFFSSIIEGVSLLLLTTAPVLPVAYFLDSFGLPGVCLKEIKSVEEVLMEFEDHKNTTKWEDEELYDATKTLLNALNVRHITPSPPINKSDNEELIFAAKQFLKVLNK
jgi:hypothetical protein